jgi:hypothetical protein
VILITRSRNLYGGIMIIVFRRVAHENACDDLMKEVSNSCCYLKLFWRNGKTAKKP